MKPLKVLVLTVIAAGALLAFVGTGTASATELTCSAGAMCSSESTVIHATSEGHIVLDAPYGNVECNSTIEGAASTGSSTTTVSGNLSSLVFNGCTGGATVHVLKPGSIEIHTATTSVDGNGTLTSTGAEVTVELFGFHCIYSTQNTDIGKITGSRNTASTATIDISATIPRTAGRTGILCGQTAPLTGSYLITTPMYLDVD